MFITVKDMLYGKIYDKKVTNKQICLTGECWSGPDSHLTYYRDGISGTRCVNQCFDPCTETSPFCSGTGFANYVYRISKEDNLRKPDIRVNFKSRKSFICNSCDYRLSSRGGSWVKKPRTRNAAVPERSPALTTSFCFTVAPCSNLRI